MNLVMSETGKKKNTSFILSLDLSKAYDGVKRSKLLNILEERAKRE